MNTPVVKELLIDELQDLLHAENQLVAAIPKMAQAAKHPALKEAFERHLMQTQNHVERLNQVFELLGEEAQPRTCRAIQGLVEESEEVIERGEQKDEIAADLGLICAAQKVEHYEIAAYGNARALARQIGAFDAATLLTQTLGEEEGADFMLTLISAPLLQQASFEAMSSELAGATR